MTDPLGKVRPMRGKTHSAKRGKIHATSTPAKMSVARKARAAREKAREKFCARWRLDEALISPDDMEL